MEENNASAHLQLMFVALCFDWDWDEAERQLRRAFQLAPNDANCHWAYGIWLRVTGRHERAIAAMKQAVALDPLSAPISYGLAGAYYWVHQYDAALKACKDAIELDPAFVSAYELLALLYARKGAYQEAFAQLEQSLTKHRSGECDQIARAIVYAMSGRRNEAQQTLSEVKQGNAPRYVTARCTVRFRPRAPSNHSVTAQLGSEDTCEIRRVAGLWRSSSKLCPKLQSRGILRWLCRRRLL